MMKTLLIRLGLYGGTLFLVLYPPVSSVLREGIVSAFSYFAHDAFYYLSVAKNSVFGHFTFDGMRPTNGFHPLWQWILTLLVKVSSNTDIQINLTHYLGIAIVACAGLVLATVVYALTRSILLSLLLFPGFCSLLFGWGSPWSYMNGMESPLSLFFGGLLLWIIYRFAVVLRRPTAYFGWVGSVLPFIMLSRLDDVFLVPCFFVQALLWDGSRAEKIRRGLLVAVPSAVVLVAYLAFNYSYSGMFLPVSGATKSGFALFENLRDMSSNLLVGSDEGKHTQLMFPALTAAALLVLMRALCASSGRLCVYAPVLAYVLVKAAYNLVAVRFVDQGMWYYALSIAVVNVVAIAYLRELISAARLPTSAGVWLIAPLLYASLLRMSDFVRGQHGLHYGMYVTYSQGAALRRQIEERVPNPRLLEVDDGILNYSLGLPTMSGLGLTLDREGYEEMKAKGSLLKLALARSFTIIGSEQYLGLQRSDAWRITADMTSEEIARLLTLFYPDAGDYSYKVILVDTNSGAVFIEFREKPLDVRAVGQPM